VPEEQGGAADLIGHRAGQAHGRKHQEPIENEIQSHFERSARSGVGGGVRHEIIEHQIDVH